MEITPEKPSENAEDEKQEQNAEPAVTDIFFSSDGRFAPGDALGIVEPVGFTVLQGGSAVRVF